MILKKLNIVARNCHQFFRKTLYSVCTEVGKHLPELKKI